MMRTLNRACLLGTAAALFAAMTTTVTSAAAAQGFDWKAHKGETIDFLANNNPWTTAVLKYKNDFEQKTGIHLRVDTYQEQQMRQRLVTVLNAHSNEVDIYMTLPSREGEQFEASGWYENLAPLAKDKAAPGYKFGDLSPALLKAATFNGVLTGIPLNIEGPLLYYRTDIFTACKLAPPKTLDDIAADAKTVKACKPDMIAFASRGLKAALAYTFSAVLHNMGGSYMQNGKSALCSPAGKKALSYYADLLKSYGPPGVVNDSFYQLTALYRAGRSVMSFESSNEFPSVMQGGARLKDTALMPLPAGPGGSHPTVIGWALAISPYSSHKDAAWDFVQWATSPEMQAKLALEGIAPPRKSVATSPQYQAWLKQQKIRQEWQDALGVLAETGTSEVGYPIVRNAESRDYVGDAVDKLLLGTATVDQACAAADKQLDALIAQK